MDTETLPISAILLIQKKNTNAHIFRGYHMLYLLTEFRFQMLSMWGQSDEIGKVAFSCTGKTLC